MAKFHGSCPPAESTPLPVDSTGRTHAARDPACLHHLRLRDLHHSGPEQHHAAGLRGELRVRAQPAPCPRDQYRLRCDGGGVGAGLGRLSKTIPRCTPRCASWAALTCCTRPGRSRRPRQCRTLHPMAGRSGSGKQQAFNGSIKAWIMAIRAITAYLPTGGGMQAVVLLALLFALVNALA